MADKEKKDVVLMNRGPRDFTVASGVLKAGGSLAVTAEEAKQLMSYRDVVDASKIVNLPKEDSAGLKKELGKLEKENEKLTEQLAAANEENDKLRESLNEAKAKLKDK
jgi:septal ring factor EnvC (AmiA/AmiB activator)